MLTKNILCDSFKALKCWIFVLIIVVSILASQSQARPFSNLRSRLADENSIENKVIILKKRLVENVPAANLTVSNSSLTLLNVSDSQVAQPATELNKIQDSKNNSVLPISNNTISNLTETNNNQTNLIVEKELTTLSAKEEASTKADLSSGKKNDEDEAEEEAEEVDKENNEKDDDTKNEKDNGEEEDNEAEKDDNEAEKDDKDIENSNDENEKLDKDEKNNEKNEEEEENDNEDADAKDVDDEKADEEETEKEKPSKPDSQKLKNKEVYDDGEESTTNFLTYFLVISAACVIFYIVYHNKSKIMAMIVEGKRPAPGQRRIESKVYHRLENVQDALPNLK